jgi:hypothetical protein
VAPQVSLSQPSALAVMVRAPTCHAAQDDPHTRIHYQRGAWQDRKVGDAALHPHQGGPCLQDHAPRPPWGHARLPCARAAFQVWTQSPGFPPSASGFVPRSMTALRWQATHSQEDDNLVLCCIAELVLPAERTAERQPKNRGKDLLVHAPQPRTRPLRSVVRGRLTRSPFPRIASACGCRASCLDHGFFSSLVP